MRECRDLWGKRIRNIFAVLEDFDHDVISANRETIQQMTIVREGHLCCLETLRFPVSMWNIDGGSSIGWKTLALNSLWFLSAVLKLMWFIVQNQFSAVIRSQRIVSVLFVICKALRLMYTIIKLITYVWYLTN